MPFVPVALDAPPITGSGGRATIIDNMAVPVPPVLMALMVAVNVPLTVGVPEISPVDALTPKPGGRLAAPKLVGLLMAVIWNVKPTPSVPVAIEVLLITGALTVAAAIVATRNPTPSFPFTGWRDSRSEDCKSFAVLAHCPPRTPRPAPFTASFHW